MQTMNTMKLQRSAPAAAGVQRPVPQMAAGFPGTSRRRASVVRGATNNATNGGKGKDFDFDAFATQANGKLKEWGEQAQDSARRTWRKLDSEYQLQDKAARAARRIEEQARDVDQTFNVRRKVRSNVEHVQRMWPVWRARLDAFSATPVGRVTMLVVIFGLISTPFFWSVLNFALLFMWLAIPLSAALIGQAQRRATEAAAAAAEAERQRANPFADAFRTFRQQQQQQRPSSPGFGSSGGGYSVQQPGPVVDAEFVVLDEEDKKGKK